MLIAFTIHNGEEIAFHDCGTGPDPRVLSRLGLTVADYRPERMAIATSILSVLVMTSTWTGFPPAPTPRAATVGTAAAGALSVNAIGHLLQAVVRQKYNPGLITAPVLLTTSLAAIGEFKSAALVSNARIAVAVGAGAAFSLPAIVTSLRAARLLSGIVAGRRKEES